ncbi:unnamed protein product [Notodromas monacha]|uniref:Uncharacterized protein n=1 Tax=Notodromas monacha TaxID=399045 RepID=A0A7R9BTE8_9CRUS|nr:unnamed protein product [Notodromas monacha]CAG0921413.1 unnamed protein product [Notodromas monacha]
MRADCWFGRGMTCNMRDGTVSTSGMFNNMYMKMTETTPIIKSSEVGWKIHLHDPKDIPVLDIQTHGFTVLPGWSKDVRLQIRDFRTLNTKQRPCDDSESYSMSKCTTRCFSDELLRKAGCLLPYVANVIPNAPTCETPSSYVAAEKAAKELFFSGQWNPNDCLCARSCDQTYFTPHGEAVLSNENASRIRIYYQEMTYDDISESFAYTEIPLLCDIGGALGLMLGASVLTFVEVLETFWSFVLKFRGKTKRKTKSAKSNHSFMPT